MTETKEFSRLKLGVGTVIWKRSSTGEKLILMGERNTEPIGKWALPGGTMDDEVSTPNSDYKDVNIKIAAAREIFEECGIEVKSDDLKVVSIDERDVRKSRYLNFGCEIEVSPDTEVSLERATHRNEMSEWKWFNVNELNEQNIFGPCIPTIKSFQQGKIQVK